jgi:hypothetical protein
MSESDQSSYTTPGSRLARPRALAQDAGDDEEIELAPLGREQGRGGVRTPQTLGDEEAWSSDKESAEFSFLTDYRIKLSQPVTFKGQEHQNAILVAEKLTQDEAVTIEVRKNSNDLIIIAVMNGEDIKSYYVTQVQTNDDNNLTIIPKAQILFENTKQANRIKTSYKTVLHTVTLPAKSTSQIAARSDARSRSSSASSTTAEFGETEELFDGDRNAGAGSGGSVGDEAEIMANFGSALKDAEQPELAETVAKAPPTAVRKVAKRVVEVSGDMDGSGTVSRPEKEALSLAQRVLKFFSWPSKKPTSFSRSRASSNASSATAGDDSEAREPLMTDPNQPYGIPRSPARGAVWF